MLTVRRRLPVQLAVGTAAFALRERLDRALLGVAESGVLDDRR
ncbi:MAG: hypothetical protein ABEH78_02260 [Haloferacaceae archaeon]